jgi:hypothetical protein
VLRPDGALEIFTAETRAAILAGYAGKLALVEKTADPGTPDVVPRLHLRPGDALSLGSRRLTVARTLAKSVDGCATVVVARSDAASAANGAGDVLVKLFPPESRAEAQWEHAMLVTAHDRLAAADDLRGCLMAPIALCGGAAHPALVVQFYATATLQDVVNVFRTQGKKVDEPLVLYYAAELARVIAGLHAAGIVHGDIKPDNVLLRGTGESGGAAEDDGGEWPAWSAARPGVWARRGLRLIDFGQAIDTRAPLVRGKALFGDTFTDGFRIPEMLEARPWGPERIDAFGLCAVLHVLLHGEYMRVVTDPRTGRYRAKEPFKRYWQTALWESVFDALLNPDGAPVAEVQQSIEGLLKANDSIARRVRTQLAKVDLALEDFRGAA